MEIYRIEARDGKARAGTLNLPRGPVPTPAFMPVATQGAVKAASHEELERLGFRLVMANTYHLAVRPGIEVIRRRGGLHRFMSWPGSIATDSGGFQVMSLAKYRKITDSGAVFRSPIDGNEHCFTPESVVAAQEAMGSDLYMCLDECPAAGCTREEAGRAADRTRDWALRSLAARASGAGSLFGIVQGGIYADLRVRCAREIAEMGFDGLAIGGLSVGEPRKETFAALDAAMPGLPEDRVRYLMGVGEPGDVIEAVSRGVDLFDCVFPTRVARNGLALTRTGRVVIRNAAAAEEDVPLDSGCGCPACRRYTRAYLRHLLHAGEILGLMLLTLHNLAFMRDLLDAARKAILGGGFEGFRREWGAPWKRGEGEPDAARE